MLLVGRTPFNLNNVDDLTIINNIKTLNVEFPENINVSNEAKELI